MDRKTGYLRYAVYYPMLHPAYQFGLCCFYRPKGKWGRFLFGLELEDRRCPEHSSQSIFSLTGKVVDEVGLACMARESWKPNLVLA